MNTYPSQSAAYFTTDDCDLAEFTTLTQRATAATDAPQAAEIAENVPIYDVPSLSTVLTNDSQRRDLMAEWAHILRYGAGALVLRTAYTDTSAIDAASAIYNDIIATENAASGKKADHFAKAGANDRIWNSLQKLCLADPQVFARYFGNPAIEAVCEAWLGPNYQMTAQVNLVRPGGGAQQAHRDYHLGFQSEDLCARYPAHVHDLSPVLTLQGAIAHCDMPVVSGPTKLLPFSQTYRAGYAAYRREDFRAYFEAHCIQLPLKKGDALFFNPALFHAAGANTSPDIQRMANLVQVSSAMGRALEAIDRAAMSRALYPAIVSLQADGALTPDQVRAAVASAAEGYSFPTNLDLDPPIGGLAPETMAALFHRALAAGLAAEQFNAELDAMLTRQKA